MFTVTMEWLKENYGSIGEAQERQAIAWLEKYGDFRTFNRMEIPALIMKWSKWKHLQEYQVNTVNIVDKALAMVGKEYFTELAAHKEINLMRVPLAASYEEALVKVKPKTILELGVGGDSAISTAVFLAYVEANDGKLDSVDINPLGKTWERYKKFPFLWTFTQSPAEDYLREAIGRDCKYDMVFIDTSHSYEPTIKEMKLASAITTNLLMDDALFEGNENDIQKGGVKRAIAEWTETHLDWKKTDFWGGSTVLLENFS